MSSMGSDPPERLQVRVYGDRTRPTLIYLPGVHGDWTLVGSFRTAVRERVRWVEFTYPRTTQWSVADYADAILEALRAQGVQRGWLLGESFGSQVAWGVVERLAAAAPQGARPLENPAGFACEGVILAGGFVRHPMPWAARVIQLLWTVAPLASLRLFLRFYLAFARFRHRHAREVLADLGEFARRRTAADQRALGHRLGLVARNDPRPIARATRLPVYYLSGWLDPVVPWPWVIASLRQHCPAYREHRILWPADHNVLSTAPHPAARLVLDWMGLGGGGNQ